MTKIITNINQKEGDFFKKVYEVTKLIPHGRVCSYGAIAKYLGSGRSARMVGWALNGCHRLADYVPAHRVVNRNGLLTGRHHFRTPTLMEELLENEGIVVIQNKVKDFKQLFWDPLKELE